MTVFSGSIKLSLQEQKKQQFSSHCQRVVFIISIGHHEVIAVPNSLRREAMTFGVHRPLVYKCADGFLTMQLVFVCVILTASAGGFSFSAPGHHMTLSHMLHEDTWWRRVELPVFTFVSIA